LKLRPLFDKMFLSNYVALRDGTTNELDE